MREWIISRENESLNPTAYQVDRSPISLRSEADIDPRRSIRNTRLKAVVQPFCWVVENNLEFDMQHED